MPPPTLGRKGKLVDPAGDPVVQAALNELVPIDYIVDWFKHRLTLTGIMNRVLILKSETASGKSTYFLSELYRRVIRGTNGPGMVCTQPRILTAIRNIAEIIKYNKDIFVLGGAVGYNAGGMKVLPNTITSLLSVTIGVLGMELKMHTDEELIARYRYIIIDETHERDLHIDMTLYMLKNFLIRNQYNPKCPFVICMSATFEPERFVEYFMGTLRGNYIWVQGASYPKELKWDWNDGRVINDFARGAAECVRRIITEAPDDPPLQADVLIFMPGGEEFTLTSAQLVALNRELAHKDLPVFSLLRIDSDAMKTKNLEYSRLDIPVESHTVIIDGKKYTPTRRVIISTNVAETGLTLHNLKYVIDAGFNKETEFNPNFNINSLLVKPAPVSRIEQRIGRCGRNFPGVFYPLYPKYIYDKLPKQQLPQILTDDASSIMVDIIREQARAVAADPTESAFNLAAIDMLDTPSGDMITYSMGKLYQIGFVSMIPDMAVDGPARYRLTQLGALSSVFTLLPPESVRMILSSFAWECSALDVISMAAYITLPTRDFKMFNRETMMLEVVNWGEIYKLGMSIRMDYDKWRILVCDEFIDGIVLIGAIKSVAMHGGVQKWCVKNNISYRGVLNFIRARDDIIEQALRAGFDIFKNEKKSLLKCTEANVMETVVRLKHCIYDGYRCNMLVNKANVYTSTYGDLPLVTPAILFPHSERYKFNLMPEIILYNSLGVKLNRKDPLRTYNIVADRISTMSGFVAVDMKFAVAAIA